MTIDERGGPRARPELPGIAGGSQRRPVLGDDVVREGDVFEVSCDVAAFDALKKALAAKEIKTQTAEITKLPGTTIQIDAKTGEKVLRLMDAFEDHDDVQHVYSNFDMPDEVLAQLG